MTTHYIDDVPRHNVDYVLILHDINNVTRTDIMTTFVAPESREKFTEAMATLSAHEALVMKGPAMDTFYSYKFSCKV